MYSFGTQIWVEDIAMLYKSTEMPTRWYSAELEEITYFATGSSQVAAVR